MVLNICSATTDLIIPRPPPEFLQLKSSWTIIFLVSPQMKFQISLLTLPATKWDKHVSVVNNQCVTSITSCYVCIFFHFSVCICFPLFLCSVLRVSNIYIYIYEVDWDIRIPDNNRAVFFLIDPFSRCCTLRLYTEIMLFKRNKELLHVFIIIKASLLDEWHLGILFFWMS